MDFVYEGLCSVQECKAGSNSNCKMPESERGSSFVPSSDLQHIPLTFSLLLTFVFTSVFGSAGGVWSEERKPQTLVFGWQRNPFWVAEIHLAEKYIWFAEKYTWLTEKYTWLAENTLGLQRNTLGLQRNLLGWQINIFVLQRNTLG